MEELSIEQKAKAYDEALEKSKRLYEQGTITESLAYIFPELKESEEEMIRKELLDFCKNRAEYYPNDPKYKNISAWIAWLEKQGEQKPTEWSEEDIMRIDNIIAIIEGKGYPDYVRWLESLKDKVSPQPKQEWSEEDETVLGNLIWALENDMVRANDRDEYVNWLKSLRPEDRWKPSLLRNLKKQ